MDRKNETYRTPEIKVIRFPSEEVLTLSGETPHGLTLPVDSFD